MIVELIKEKEEIDRIISEKIAGKKLVFTNYYWMGIAEKGIEHEKVLEVFEQFDKVSEIEKEMLKYGDIGYELFYNLSNNSYFSIATCRRTVKF